jgi:hypothetical protein
MQRFRSFDRWVYRMRPGIAAAIAIVILASCALSDVSTPPESVTATGAVNTAEASAASPPLSDAAKTASASASQSPSLAAELVADGLAEVLVDHLTLRSEPGTGAERIGLLPLGEPAYVVAGPVEADGYRWYQLASVRQPYGGTCGDPAPKPSLECAVWFGWAAGVTPDQDRWLGFRDADCSSARDTEAYLARLPAERLACAGSGEWRLTAYMAPSSEGRGCYPVYVVDPGWLDPSCNFLLLQPEESQYDSFEDLQVFVHPDLGSCTLGADRSDCPFEALKGSWVELTGHLDDPAADSCVPVLSSNFEEPPYPPPSIDEVVFGCRTRLVVTGVKPIPAPGG